ncbi:hypothetical protein APSETT445_008718 [Aspergillus pseudonomiae]
MARSSSPPLIFDLDEIPTNPSALDTAVDDSPVLDFLNMPEIDSFPAVELSDHSTGETTLNSAERCASIVISFTRRLTSSDFTGFWYSFVVKMPDFLIDLLKRNKSAASKQPRDVLPDSASEMTLIE